MKHSDNSRPLLPADTVWVPVTGSNHARFGWYGNLACLERRVLFIELDALALIVMYFAGLWVLYSRGITP